MIFVSNKTRAYRQLGPPELLHNCHGQGYCRVEMSCSALFQILFVETNKVQILFEEKTTSRYTPRYTDPDHEGKTVAKRHVDEVASLVSDGSSVG